MVINQQFSIHGFVKCLNVISATCKILYNDPYLFAVNGSQATQGTVLKDNDVICNTVHRLVKNNVIDERGWGLVLKDILLSLVSLKTGLS